MGKPQKEHMEGFGGGRGEAYNIETEVRVTGKDREPRGTETDADRRKGERQAGRDVERHANMPSEDCRRVRRGET